MRLRIKFAKTGWLRYTGHLDMQTVWERTARRAVLPLAYTHGFHPGPKIQIASALPLGYAGRAEIVDMWLQEDVGAAPCDIPGSDAQVLPYAKMLQSAAPPGLTILSAKQVDEAGPALQTQVASAEYMVTLLDPVDDTELVNRLAAALAAVSLPRQRRGKDYDLRPLIESLSILPPQDPVVGIPSDGRPGVGIFMRLAAREGATGRPEEVLDVLGIPYETTHVERTRIILKSEIE
jgi:radical SAM-linked protein